MAQGHPRRQGGKKPADPFPYRLSQVERNWQDKFEAVVSN